METKHLTTKNFSELEGTGSPNGVITPIYKGQIYRDLSVNPNGIWMSAGLTNDSWQNLLGFPDSLIHYSEVEGVDSKWSNYKVKRTVITGLRASFEIEVYNDGKTSFSINDVIPQNFLGKSFFKLNRLTYLIKKLYGWDSSTGRVLRDGTITTTAGSPIVTGVGTDFVEDFNVNDKIYDSVGTFIGNVQTVDSSTQITLTTNAAIVVTNSPVRAFRWCDTTGFSRVGFNDIINSSASVPNTITKIKIEGLQTGHMQQFEGTMGISYNLPTDDIDPLVPSGYTPGYLPKNLTIDSLDMTYDPYELSVSGCSEGSFVIILDGYLL